jgi:hypothetical protein
LARSWEGTEWITGSDRAASFVIGEARGCSAGCGFVYALSCAISLAGPRRSPRKKGRAEGCFDRADGERSICRMRIRSNAEGIAQSSGGRKGTDVGAPSDCVLPRLSWQNWMCSS